MKQWTSTFGFLMATLGAAVGLGNLWKFPYMLGQNGGSAFLLLFVAFTLLLGLPLMLSEFVIGGIGRGNSLSAIERIVGHRTKWSVVGAMGNFNLLIIMSFYSIISGWALVYLGYAAAGLFQGTNDATSHHLFTQMMSSHTTLLSGHTLFIVLTGGIIYTGVQSGLERTSKIMMPLLFMLLLIIVIFNTFSAGFSETLTFLFTPDFSKITSHVVLDALGQACFSLATGAGCLCIYAAYIKDKGSILGQSLFIVGANIVIAVLAGLAIFPIVFTHGLDPAAGASLIFETLPLALGNMVGGYVLGIGLFLLFVFAALTSSISLIESPVAYLEDEKDISRHKGTGIIMLITWSLGAFYILCMGSDYDIFDDAINLSTNIVLPLTAMGFSLFVGIKIKKPDTYQYLNLTRPVFQNTLILTLKYAIPLALGVILVCNLAT